MRRVSAASVDSQFPVDPRYTGPAPGSSAIGCNGLGCLLAPVATRERRGI